MPKHTSPPARARLLVRIGEAMRALYTYDALVDRERGSPEPGTTAMVRTLAYCMTFVRTAIAHGIVDADFGAVVRMALEHEAEGWEEHRAHCVKCGGH